VTQATQEGTDTFVERGGGSQRALQVAGGDFTIVRGRLGSPKAQRLAVAGNRLL